MARVPATPARHRFTVEEYEALSRLEEFWDGPRLELVEGEIVEMTPIGPDHASCVMRLNAHFAAQLGDRGVVNVQNPLRLGDLSEPQPDVTILRPPLERYRHRQPEADDVLLLVEVSNSSLQFDRQQKVPLYARHGVAEVWVVDLTGEAVEIHREPGPEGYGVLERQVRGETLAPAAFPEAGLAAEQILG